MENAALVSWFIDGILKAGLPTGAIIVAAWWLRGYISDNTAAIKSIKQDFENLRAEHAETKKSVVRAHERIDNFQLHASHMGE